MKCPKCSFTSFDYRDECSRCGSDLRDVRTLLQIIAVSPEERAPARPEPAPAPASPTRLVHEAAHTPAGVEPEEEVTFDDLKFDESFQDMVESTRYVPTEPTASPPAEADDEILDLDFDDIFGDRKDP